MVIPKSPYTYVWKKFIEKGYGKALGNAIDTNKWKLYLYFSLILPFSFE